jgi:aminoglycoside phosphotransferase (APT) family kinase protein
MPEPGTPRLIYGDFHIGQLLVEGDSICFLDLDSLVIGDPEQDLAEFAVALMFARLPTDRLCAMASALLSAYVGSARWRLSPQRMRWHATVQFVTRLHRYYRELRPGWEAALQHSLEDLNLDVLLAEITSAAV